MATEVDSSITSQFYADFGLPMAYNKTEQLPPPLVYTAVRIPSTVNTAEYIKPFTNPAVVVNELVNHRFSPITQQRYNSQQILSITQCIDNQEKTVNNRLAVALCVSILGITIGLTCIGLFVAYHSDLCGHYQTYTSCARPYSALIIGCISVFLGLLRITIYCRLKMKISHAQKIWQERVVQLQQTSIHGY